MTKYLSSAGQGAKFRAMQICYWCSYGAFCAFAIAYFTDCGMNAAQSGLLAGGYTMGALAGQWFLGWLCDRMNTIKKVFAAAGVLSCCTVAAIFAVPKTMLFVMPLYVLLGFFESPLATMLDAWILRSYADCPQRYGEIRAWGSLGYAVFMLFFGSLIQCIGYIVSLVTAIVLMAGLLGLAASIPDQSMRKVSVRTSSLALWKNRGFVFAVIIGFLIGLASSPLMQFNALYFNAVGGTLSQQSIALCASAFIQVPMMLSTRRLSKISVNVRLVIAAAMYLLCCGMVGAASSPYQIIAANLFQGVGYGIWLPTLREAVFRSAPPALATTAQGICDAFTIAVAGTVSSLAGGRMIGEYGVGKFMLVCMAVQILALALLAVNEIKKRRCKDAVYSCTDQNADQ